MDTHSIILGVIVIIILYIVYMYYFGNSSTSYLAGLHDAKTSMTISSSNLPGGATAD